ncbi:MAG: histidine ammonia-lyase, partial [Myxococcales bacterium]|nr:histidine ammonia-lyase [Myxococcales bacterium]
LAEQKISQEDQNLLQKNIILSHAVGVGEALDFATAKAMTLLRLNTLIQGFSGASPQLIHNLMTLINANIAPLVPHKGSVGASGDLAPLAHLGLLLLGLGNCYDRRIMSKSESALKRCGLNPLELGIRDGLALINGTQAMAASAIISLIECDKLALLSDITGACTLEALSGHKTPFDKRIHELKPHYGQQITASNMRTALEGSFVQKHIKNPLTQDPYSLRCIPQVHGASKDVIRHVQEIVERELNAVTDNPLIFHDETKDELSILSGGNFHGQSLALALDYLALAMAELANISERRIELLLNDKHSNGLPAFLTPKSGLNSGYMMLHVTATSLVNENKILCHPASVDSIPTSANREDHVSMGMTSANKLRKVIKNTLTVLAIELTASHQALGLRPPCTFGQGVQRLHDELSKIVPLRTCDTLYIDDLSIILEFTQSSQFSILINYIFNKK